MLLKIKAAAVAAAIAGACATGACAETKGEQKSGQAGAQPAAKAGRPPVAVATVAATTADLTEAVDVVGSLAAKFSAEVKSEVSGVVNAVYVTQWVPVRRGTPLARLDTSETAAALEAIKAVEAQARVGEARAEREHERAVQLRAFGLITSQAFDEATSALEAAKAATLAARAQVRTGEARLAKSSITSPMDGVVAERNVNVGDRVENVGGGGTMFRIVDNRLLNLTVTVPSPRLGSLKVGQRLEFTADAVPDRTFTGRVMFINPAVDVASRAAKVIGEVPNADGALKEGLFVRGRILTVVRTNVLQVPREALVNWNVADGTADVFIVAGEKAEKRAVRTGAANGASVEIRDGLASGEQVVTRGAFALRHGDPVTVARAQGS
ncbi:MAG TPA: efflux RND transporter periplasmic adaptor subunit [Vicinamibacterales bacterium]|nr:efflux RND transporter periplasmic adaptor subunit [Vicinamibacterales bacterium]